MKRLSMGADADTKMKKIKLDQEEAEEEDLRIADEGPSRSEEEDGTGSQIAFTHLDENLLFEILKHADARTLGAAACVSKLWHRTAEDERIWELICTKHLANIGCGIQQLRSVVLPLGGFRRLHSLYLWPLSKPQSSSTRISSTSKPSSSSAAASSSTSTAWARLAPMIGSKPTTRWGKDEVNLSLSLLSIRYYEKMNFSKKSSR